MQQTTNYNLLIPEGTDIVNPLTQVNPNFQTIDGAMFANKQSGIGTASEVVTGTVHAVIRNNPDSDVFRFTATGAWTAGDTMTLDGQQVTVHLSDGTTPATNSYIIGAEVLAMVNGTLVTLAISTTPPAQGVTSFNSRTGAVVPTASDYDASMVDYDNTVSGLNATDVQSAIDELASTGGSGILFEAWTNPDSSQSFAGQDIIINDGNNYKMFLIEFVTQGIDCWTGTVNAAGGTGLSNYFTISGAGLVAKQSRTFTSSAVGTTFTLHFNDGMDTTLNTYGAAPANVTNNTHMIPARIYGII